MTKEMLADGCLACLNIKSLFCSPDVWTLSHDCSQLFRFSVC